MNLNVITGATGFVGGGLIRKLLKNEKKVWVLVRSGSKVSAKERIKAKFPDQYEKIEVVESDILKENLGLDEEFLSFLKKNKVIFWHLAANLSFATKDKDLVYKTNFIGTKNVVNLANKLNFQKIIYLSTAYVSGDYKGKIFEDKIIENQKFRNMYELSKYKAEKYLRENIKVGYLIFRPSVILGEVYSGKAVGCTFGYYRFLYMVFLLREWVIKKKNSKKTFWNILLRILATKYDKKNNFLYLPWLIIPYVKKGRVDLISVSYVVELMMRVNNSKEKNKTFHLTNNNPAEPKFLMDLILKSLNIRKAKYLNMPEFLLRFILRVFYYLTYPIKDYTKSIYWYLPYIVRNYDFDKTNVKKYEVGVEEKLDEKYMNKVNEYAKKNIFNKIKNPKLVIYEEDEK